MGFIIKNTNQEPENNSLKIGEDVEIIEDKTQGVVVLKLGNLYQVRLKSGQIRTYRQNELKKV